MLTTIKGIVNVEEIIRNLHHQLEETKTKPFNKTGLQSLFKRILSSRYGFPVWTPDEQFDYRNHVVSIGSHYNGKPITMKNIKITISDLCRRVPNSCLPPWEIFLIYVQSPLSREPDETVLFIRTHRYLAINSITPAINMFDHKEFLASSSLIKLNINPVQSFGKPVFAKDSVTKNVTRDVLKSTMATIDRYRTKCDPNVPNMDTSCDPLWTSVRGFVKIARNTNNKLQKWTDSYTEIGTPNMRVTWSRSTALVHLATRIVCSVLDYLWEISITGLARNLFLQSITQLPVGIQILQSIVQKVTRTLHSIFRKLQSCKTKKQLLWLCVKEFNLTVKAITLAPFYMFIRCASQRGKISYNLLDQFQPAYQTLAWSESLPMDSVLRVAHLTNSSVFEILTSAVSSALIKYVRYNTSSKNPLNIFIPIYDHLRQCDENNHSTEGYLVLKVPTTEMHNTQDHLENIKSQMTRPDTEFQYFLNMMFHKYLAPYIPKVINSYFYSKANDQCTFQLHHTIIPLLNNKTTINGNVVDSICYWNTKTVPSMNLMMGRDQVTLVVSGNSGNLVHPNKIANQFVREFQSLVWVANSNSVKNNSIR
ncbi:hypothetical protein CHUAL_013190 [Chamberlinius hualienensis]